MASPSPGLGRSPRSRRTLLSAATSVAVVVLAVIGAFSIPALASGTSVPTVRSTVTPVTAAVASLNVGGGPAAGRSASCSVAGSGSVSCLFGPRPATGPNTSGRVWTDLTTILGDNAPASRWIGQMAYDPLDHYVVLFGGDNESTSGAYSDTWTFSGGVWTELSPSTSPPERYGGGMVWDAADGYLLLFGGHDYPTGTTYNDTWTFVHGTWTELYPTTYPAARWRFGMTYDASDGYVLLFGGTDSTGATLYADTWKFVGGNWTDLAGKVTGTPPATYRTEMAYDPVGGYAVMFGGCTSSTCPDQSTYTYHNLTWKLLSPSTKPSARMYFGFTYDSVIGGIVLFGGTNSATEDTTVQDTWVFSNGTWTDITSDVGTAPSDRGFMNMAFDGADNYTLMFGGASTGTTTTPLGQTWILGPEVLARLTLSAPVADLGQTVELNATPLAAHGSVTFNYTGLPPGCTSANLTLLNCTPVDTGVYAITVHDNSTAGGVSNATASLTVASDPAILSFVANRTVVTEGSSLGLNTTVGGGSPPYRYTYTGLPSGCGSSNTPTPVCTPTSSGNYTVEVTVTDAASYSVHGSLDLTVNGRPAVSLVSAYPAVVDVGQPTDISVEEAGGTAPLSYSYTGLPTGCASADTAVLACTPTVSGTFTISVIVTDADGWRSTMTGTFTANPDPSIIGFVAAPALLDLGTAVHLWLNATGGTGALTFAYSGLPTGCSLGAASSGICTPTVPGTFNITGTVTDGLGFSVRMPLTVTVNSDPTVTLVKVAPAAIDVGQTAQIQVVFTGGTAPYTFAYTGLPVGCAPPTTAFANCTGRSAGSSTISVVLTDHLKETSTLSGSLIVYSRPAVTSFSSTYSTFTVGTSTTLTVVSTGGAGGDSYVYTGLPGGCLSRNSSTLSCTPTASGTFAVNVTVTDSLGVSAYGLLNLTVQPTSTTSSGLGGSSTILWAIVAVVVIVAIVAVVVLMRRRRPPEPAAAPAAPWTETTDENNP